jgi:CheY-like chemotaxis protein
MSSVAMVTRPLSLRHAGDLDGTALALPHHTVDSELLAGVHVLVVEDIEDSRELFEMMLEYRGALVSTAASVTEAKNILERVTPNVVLSDIALPDDGLQLVRDVREMGLNVPVVAITAHVAMYDRATLRELGFAEVLYKPVSSDRLCETVAEVARRPPPR